MKKIAVLYLSSIVGVALFTGVASAHVTVSPKETVQGSYEVFTVRVPTEKDVPTIKVEVKVPADVAISRFEPKPGWNYQLQKDASGNITDVVWTATGEGLSATEFGDFKMQGKVQDTATHIVWKAYQTYKDGSVVEWIGAEGSDKPAFVTTVMDKTMAAHNSGSTTMAAGNSIPVGTINELSKDQSFSAKLPLLFSIAALIAGLISLFISLKKKTKKWQMQNSTSHNL